MNKVKSSIFILIAAIAIPLLILSLARPVKLTEAEKVAAANADYYEEIFSKCSDIRPLSQFIEIFEPSGALEFFDNATLKEVVSIVAVAEIDGGFEASFVASVSVTETGQYQLTEQPKFTIRDLKGGIFTKNLPNGRVTGPSISLGPILWNRFIASGADIQSLREIDIHSREA